ncbi:hypothetical protein LSTR_LSTR008211 [Laodelphax striatellus]|uniref:Uncharacterized protein n=1 Tax=Laodelphax striatellus TaxID=195883 RepID=A0A482WJ70_LAOST|nr:hypothetical protein LSTR_LSTR008211 [Laodelphax striatellus]
MLTGRPLDSAQKVGLEESGGPGGTFSSGVDGISKVEKHTSSGNGKYFSLTHSNGKGFACFVFPPLTKCKGEALALPGCTAHQPLNNLARTEPLRLRKHSATLLHNNIAWAEAHAFSRMTAPPPLPTILQGRSSCLPGSTAPPPPSQQYCKGGALAPQDAQHHHPPPNNIAWVEALAFQDHSTTPPSQQYCKGGALASQDAQHHLLPPNNIARAEPLPPGCTAPPPRPNNIGKGGPLAFPGCTALPFPTNNIVYRREPLPPRMHSTTTPLQTISDGGALPSRMHSTTILHNNIAWAEPLPSRMHSATFSLQQYCKCGALASQDAQAQGLGRIWPSLATHEIACIFSWHRKMLNNYTIDSAQKVEKSPPPLTMVMPPRFFQLSS